MNKEENSNINNKGDKIELPKDLHVLVVDDDSIFRESISKLLKQLGFRVTAVEGGSQALQLLKEQVSGKKSDPFGLLLLDVFMPEMDGFELLRILKQAYSLDLPTIMISSSEDPDTISKCFQCGAEDFLQKPVRLDLLKIRIEYCLTDRARRKQEKEKLNALKREREEIDHLTQELERYRSEISDKIETPMQAVMKTITELMKHKTTEGDTSIDQYKGHLIAILKSLGSHDLYKPAFEDLDIETRKWLQMEYTKMPLPPLPMEERKAIPSTRKPSRTVDKSIPDLESFTCNILKYEIPELIENVTWMFKHFGLFDLYNIDMIKFANFMNRVKQGYLQPPYHNFYHAIDVTQFAFVLLNTKKIGSLLTPLDKFAVLVAALCHDIGHNGLNNTYHVNSSSYIALLYNDISVLENMHASKTFKILRQEECNIVESLTPAQYNEFRKAVISATLATDMSRHFEILTKFKTRLSTGPLTKDIKDRQLLMDVILKVADISNPVRPTEVAVQWTDRLVEEFLKQGEEEKRLGLPISHFMSKETMHKPKFQLDFYDYIAGPLFKAFVEYIPELSELMDRLNANREMWENELKKNPPKEKPVKEEGIELPTKTVYGDTDGLFLAKIKGFNVLIIENDPKAAGELQSALKDRGYECDTVENSEDAINTIPTKDYDVILLKCDLPEDGYDLINNLTSKCRFKAAQLIRKQNFKRWIPIIGIGDANLCKEELWKESGMEDCLKRPIHVKTLLNTVQYWLGKTLDKSECINLQVALEQSGDDESFLREIIELFIEESIKQINIIDQNLKTENWSVVELNAHSMKGAAAQLAAKPLSQAALDLEQAAKLKDFQASKRAFEVVKERFHSFQTNISKTLSEL